MYLSELDQRLIEETDYKKEKEAMDFLIGIIALIILLFRNPILNSAR